MKSQRTVGRPSKSWCLLLSIASLISAVASLPHTSASSSLLLPANSSPRLLPRSSGEHVTLSDCRDKTTGTVSSQMAYFPGAPGPSPQDVAVVATPAGQSRVWAYANTSGLFADTGTTFRAVLGPIVDQGQFAGRGDNGYANFTCWQNYTKSLYTYNGIVCSQVYDCNHNKAPANATIDQTPPETGLSHTALIGIIVGVVAAVLIAAGGLGFIFFRRALARRQVRRQAHELHAASSAPASSYPSTATTEESITKGGWPPKSGAYGYAHEMHAPNRYEMDGQWRGVEVHGAGTPGELEGVGRVEMAHEDPHVSRP